MVDRSYDSYLTTILNYWYHLHNYLLRLQLVLQLMLKNIHSYLIWQTLFGNISQMDYPVPTKPCNIALVITKLSRFSCYTLSLYNKSIRKIIRTLLLMHSFGYYNKFSISPVGSWTSTFQEELCCCFIIYFRTCVHPS